MRCYACDRLNATRFDGATDRHYCTTCWNVIEETMKVPDADIVGEDILTSGLRYVTLEGVLEEEEELSSAIREASEDTSDLS